MRKFIALVIVLGAVLPFFERVAFSETVNDEEFGFRFEVPEGFQSAERPAGSDVLYRFLDREPSPDDLATVIEISRLRGLIDPNQRLSEEELASPDPDGPVVTLLEPRVWQDITLDVMSIEVVAAEATVQTLVVQFPLQGEGVQLSVGGPNNRPIEQLLNESLSSFTPSNPLYRGKSDGKSDGQGVATSLDSGSTEVVPEVTFPYVGVAIFGVLILVLVAIVGSWIRSIRKA